MEDALSDAAALSLWVRSTRRAGTIRLEQRE